MREKLEDIYKTYCNKKMILMIVFGFASGFPFLLVFNTLSLWLKDVHFGYAAIGAFSLVKMPYALKWLWSPIVDGIKIPFFNKFGRRRSWGILTEICLCLSILVMSRWTIDKGALYLVASALSVSFFSATLDIVLDAYRVELFSENQDEQAAGSAVFVLGYRLGLLFSGAGALMLASFMSWNTVYVVMSFGTVLGISAMILSKEPIEVKTKIQDKMTFQSFLKENVLKPLKDLSSRANFKMILLLILIYRLSDAYVGPMAYPFYDDMGFTKFDIASVIKIYGMAATILGGIYGGLFLKKHGLYKGLYLFAWLQGATTAFYALLALIGHNIPMLILTISVENFVSGMATAALVAYMSSLCNILYTATEYALLSSLLSLTRDLFASTSGLLLECTNWPVFFIISGALCIPAAWLVKKTVKNQL